MTHWLHNSFDAVWFDAPTVHVHIRFLKAPFWALTILTAFAPAAWLNARLRCRRLRARMARNPNACPHCGYDCRATPTLCPECGRDPHPPAERRR